jgi:hypothetical protein
MAKRSRYKTHTNPGAITTAHNDKLLSELREILKHEADKGVSFSDSQLSEMLLDVGLLTNKGQIYNIRLANDIPNCRERKILNFAKQHNKKN